MIAKDREVLQYKPRTVALAVFGAWRALGGNMGPTVADA
jgi:hypothetical protein